MQRKAPSSICNAVALAAGFLAIASYCYFVSHDRIMWSDEIFGWLLNTDPSWHHMLLAWRGGVDGGGFAFYLLGRPWLAIFGHTALSFRAYSAAGCFIAYATMWLTLRRFYAPRLVLLALFLVWFGSENILWQMVQARFYGLMLAAAALVFLASVRSAEEAAKGQGLRKSTVLLTFFANALLIESHPFGLLYSGIFLMGSAASDKFSHRRRPWFYAVVLLTWPLLIFSRDALVNSAKVGKPWFWTTKPGLHELWDAYIPPAMGWLPYAMVIVLCLLLPQAANRLRIRQAIQERRVILLPMLALLVTPMALWFVSQHGTAYFEGRYMIPVELGITVLAAEVLHQISAAFLSGPQPASRIAFNCLAALLLLCTAREALVDYLRELALPPHDFTVALEAQVPRGLPVVFERFDVFDIEITKQHPPDFPMLYLLDWQVALDPESPRGIVSSTHHMENWKKYGYYPDSIQQSAVYLATAQRFIVVHYDRLKWFDRRIANNPEWHTTKVGEIQSEHWPATIWLVERR